MGKTGKKIRPLYGDEFRKVEHFRTFVNFGIKIRSNIQSNYYGIKGEKYAERNVLDSCEFKVFQKVKHIMENLKFCSKSKIE